MVFPTKDRQCKSSDISIVVSLSNRLSKQLIALITMKENNNSPHYWPLWRESDVSFVVTTVPADDTRLHNDGQIWVP